MGYFHIGSASAVERYGYCFAEYGCNGSDNRCASAILVPDENNAPKQYWDNAYIIEDIGTFGINAFKNIVDLNKCQCE